MTAVSTSIHHNVHPAGISRLALHAGLALVAWGRRSSNRPELNLDDVIALHEWEQRSKALAATDVAGRTIFLAV